MRPSGRLLAVVALAANTGVGALDCDSNPCKNSGTCIDETGGGYSCECANGIGGTPWSGKNCATAPSSNYGLVEFCHNVELELEYNSHTFSGIADTYLQGSLHCSHFRGATTKYELVTLPRLGSIGWNNSLAGKFVYSPLEVDLSVIGNSSDAKDEFQYRAVNEFGQSNWAYVTIEFKPIDSPDGMLKFIIALAGGGVFFSVLGLVRVVALQAILNPNKEYDNPLCNCLACFCQPPEEEDLTLHGKSATDYMPGWDDDDDSGEMANPLATSESADGFIDNSDEFT